MDLEKKPNMKRTRIGGGQTDVYVDSDWWCGIYGLGFVADIWWYMAAAMYLVWWWYTAADDESGVVVVYGSG